MFDTSLAALAAIALAACAATGGPPGDAPAAGTATLRLGEEARLGGLLVRALRVEEDSRCPASVQCIHAGTVRLAVRLSRGGTTREAVLRPEAPEPLGDGRFLWLVAACPSPSRPGPISPAAYSFVVSAAADITGTPVDHHCAPG